MTPGLASAADMAARGWLHWPWLPLALAGVWLAVLAVLSRGKAPGHAGSRAGLVGTGILILGWLTYACGLSVGLMFCLVALAQRWAMRHAGRVIPPAAPRTSEAMLSAAPLAVDAGANRP